MALPSPNGPVAHVACVSCSDRLSAGPEYNIPIDLISSKASPHRETCGPARVVDTSVTQRIQSLRSIVALEYPTVLDFNELRELAADVRVFVDIAEDKVEALRSVIAAYDVVLAIFPSGDGMGLHVIKGSAILDKIAQSRTHAIYSHTAIAVPDLEHAEVLKHLTAPVEQRIAA
jgi:hypothetical protein